MPSDAPAPEPGSPRTRMPGLFLNRERRIRNGWWVAIFLALLAAVLFPVVLISASLGREVSIWEQLGLICVVTVAVQLLRRRPVMEVTGPLDLRAARGLAAGLGLGFMLMAVPAAALWAAGAVRFEIQPFDPAVLLPAVALTVGVAAAEELLFRGVLFQRLVAGVGVWPAQIAIGLLFLLTHMGNPGMEGSVVFLAGLNIFLASLMFGQAFLRTGSLAMPIGLHFAANLTQGVVFGFGVSGHEKPGLLAPRFLTDAEWLTGGAFGLEASLPGLAMVAITLAILLRASRSRRDPALAT